MKFKLKIGAVLLALALLPAAVFLIHAHPAVLIGLLMAGLGVAGTVTFTYSSFQHSGAFGGGFTGGSAVAPTAAQAAQVSAMSALVGFTDTDTTWVFTHNWGLSAAQAAALLPQIIIEVVSQQAGTTAVMPVIGCNVTSNTNLVTFTKTQATYSGCTVSIWLRRAHSIGL
jgi:hypothetical protein